MNKMPELKGKEADKFARRMLEIEDEDKMDRKYCVSWIEGFKTGKREAKEEFENWMRTNKCILFNQFSTDLEDTLLNDPKDKNARKMINMIDEVWESFNEKLKEMK